MIAALILSDPLRAQLAAEARAAYPSECCGLIEAVSAGGTLTVTALHPTKNLSEAPDRFEIDPAEHIRLLRAMRGTKRGIAGCYHSHPNGAATPSATDREGALEEDFVWLIAGLGAAGAPSFGAFVFEAGGFRGLAFGG